MNKTALSEWQSYAACTAPGIDPDIFFHKNRASHSKAKSICARCRVTEECLAAAIDGKEATGIWGGRSTHERHKASSNGSTKKNQPSDD
jgi:WhiB family redox-sensing transcriptional regulator